MTGIKAKIKKIVGIVLLAVIVIAAVFAIFARVAKKDSAEPAFVFGNALLWVQTPSMEPTIEAKSFIAVKKYDGKGLAEGDIISFICRDERSEAYGKLITHRVERVTADGYKTKGDSESSYTDPWTVKEEDVVAVYGGKLTVLTFFGRLFASGAGLALIIATFVFSCAFIYMPEIIAVFKEEKSAEKEKEISRRVEEEVERMLKENGGDDNEK